MTNQHVWKRIKAKTCIDCLSPKGYYEQLSNRSRWCHDCVVKRQFIITKPETYRYLLKPWWLKFTGKMVVNKDGSILFRN